MSKTKRTYDRREAEDGFRILVDRIWLPRLKKNDAKMDLWQKDITPNVILYHFYLLNFILFLKKFMPIIKMSVYYISMSFV